MFTLICVCLSQMNCTCTLHQLKRSQILCLQMHVTETEHLRYNSLLCSAVNICHTDVPLSISIDFLIIK